MGTNEKRIDKKESIMTKEWRNTNDPPMERMDFPEAWEILTTFFGYGQCEVCGVMHDDLMLYHSYELILCDDCAEIRRKENNPDVH